MSTIVDTPEKIEAFRLLALRGALKLELIGLKKRGRSAYSIIKSEFGFKGNKRKVFNLYTRWLIDNGIYVDH